MNKLTGLGKLFFGGLSLIMICIWTGIYIGSISTAWIRAEGIATCAMLGTIGFGCVMGALIEVGDWDNKKHRFKTFLKDEDE